MDSLYSLFFFLVLVTHPIFLISFPAFVPRATVMLYSQCPYAPYFYYIFSDYLGPWQLLLFSTTGTLSFLNAVMRPSKTVALRTLFLLPEFSLHTTFTPTDSSCLVITLESLERILTSLGINLVSQPLLFRQTQNRYICILILSLSWGVFHLYPRHSCSLLAHCTESSPPFLTCILL